jgi:membrane-bound lytic murein transglycosylase MltF
MKVFLFVATFFVGGWGRSDLDPQFVKSTITVGYLESASTSFEIHLVTKFLRSLKSSIEFVKASDSAELSDWTIKQKVDLAVGGLRTSVETKILNSQPLEQATTPSVFWFGYEQKKLKKEFHKWLELSYRTGSFQSAKELFLKPVNSLTALDRSWLKKRYSRFAHFKPHVKKFAKKYQVPWKLIAAISYQESQWQVQADSHTGVEGIMQLTIDTAKFVGIQDRTHPLQSFYGGTKYFQYLLRQQPKELSERERVVLALAAYNMGLGTLKQIQEEALKEGLDPNDWMQIKSFIPQPKQKETTRFVNRVLAYWDYI